MIVNDEYVGYAVRIFSPNKYHSGRFIVQVHYEFGSAEREFWFDDYGKTVKEV